MFARSVPEVHPRIIETTLSEVRLARKEIWGQARVVAERGLRARSDSVLQVLAHAAMRGGTWQAALERAVDGSGRQARADSHPWWAALGRVMVMHAETQEDLFHAVALFDQAQRLDPQRPFGRPDYLAYVQALWDIGQRARIAQVPRRNEAWGDGESDYVELNLQRENAGCEKWVLALNETVTAPAALAPITFSPDARSRFDGLRAPSAEKVVSGPALITVVMATYRRGRELLTAVESILSQTWTSLEVIVVDDHSGAEYDEVLNEVAALDSRITVLRQDSNQGTYCARNRALEVAQGEFVTFQDDDDWSHPQRLERQVAPLLADPSVHSTLSHAVQADDDLVFRHASRRTRLMNSSSLMFRMRDLEVLGGFDPVRKGADTEFIRRLRAALPGRQVLLPETLAFVRLTGGSLSRGDFKPSWNHPTRSEYAESAEWWHRSIHAGASPRISLNPSRRSFPAPRRSLTGAREDRREYDLVLVADFSTPLVTASVGWEVMNQAIRHREQVGLLHIDDPLRLETPGRIKITEAVRRLLDSELVTRVFPEESDTCVRLVVDDPSTLELADHTPWNLRAEELQVVCHTLPVEVAEDSYWSHSDCSQLLSSVLPDSNPVWIASSGLVRDGLRSNGFTVAQDLFSRAVRLPFRLPPKTYLSFARPVVGRVGSRSEGGWAKTEQDLLATYPQGDSLDVRILGDVAPAVNTIGWSPSTWLNYRMSDIRLDAFLAQLDVYLHASVAAPTPLETRVMLRVIGLGKPVLIVGSGDSRIEEAVLRCNRSEVVDFVKELCGSPSRYKEAVNSARTAMEKAGLIVVRE